MAHDNIPIVTLAVITLATALYHHPLKAHSDVCLSIDTVWNHREWLRLFLAPFHHLNFFHIGLNMASYFLTGWYLEWSLGSGWVAYMLCTFTVFVGLVHLLLNLVLAYLLRDDAYIMHCATGFSGILFSLKIIRCAQVPAPVVELRGFPITSMMLCLVECVLIHFFSSKASFSGHLAGIFIGIAYTQGPLRTMMELLVTPKHAREKANEALMLSR